MNKINRIHVSMNGQSVGNLAMTANGLCVFEYSPEYLLTGVSISPFELPLRNGLFVAKPRPFEGGFGVFDDSLPDGWGLLVLDRYLQKKGINPCSLTLLDRLSLVGSTGRGALEFRPDNSTIDYRDYIDFERLALEAEQILSSEEYNGSGIEEFQRRGGSPGGARPKVFTHYDGKEWLVKFRAKEDPENIGLIEYRYSQLARSVGVEMPETRLFEDKYFGVERFDRTDGVKNHVISMAGLLGADYRLPSIDYQHVFKVGMFLTSNVAELWKIYRLMVFNFLIDNKDDHAKNFAFILRDGHWSFAPAFDLLPSNGINGYRTTSINDSITPTETDLIAVAEKSGLNPIEAKNIFHEIKEKVNFYSAK